MVFHSYPRLTSKTISSADLRSHNLNLIRGSEPWPFFYLCQGSSILYVQIDVCRDFCTFGALKRGPMPSSLLDTLEELLDCVFDRPAHSRLFNVAAEGSPDPVTSLLERIGSELAEKIARYARGQSDEIGPDTNLRRKADIARGLVQQNSELADDNNSGLLLLLARSFGEKTGSHRTYG